ncbi:MAG: sigma-54 dependent transcriptional regulator [Bacteroidales bacterium]|nr:sigma-54 dependent transcriptional regulator [Bacteroidales bacterium]
MMKKGKILVVDDNQGIRSALKILLPAHFAQVEIIASPKSLVTTMETFRPDVVLLDMNFYTDINTGNEGLYWTGELKRMWPEVQIVLFTAYADIVLAVEGMKRGAFDFIVKPWDNEKLISTLKAAYDSTPKGTEKTRSAIPSEMYWGSTPAMMQIRRAVEKIAPTDATVLITGENGTGKDVLAHEIHALSGRRDRPMVCVDAGAIPETLFESELFGHVKGAFTDAHSDHIGKFEQADGGTLFLDEIGNIPLHLQAKLLRVLQNRTVTRVGSERQIPVDIRLICATNMDLEKMVAEGRFREDLYYRINTMHISLPALRERPEDVMPLAQRFLAVYAGKYRRGAAEISHEAAEMLKAHAWSGNIRELQNTIEKAVILSEGTSLKAEDLSLEKKSSAKAAPRQTLDEAEAQTIRDTMARCNGNLTLVAKELGISRPTLYSKLKKYDI